VLLSAHLEVLPFLIIEQAGVQKNNSGRAEEEQKNTAGRVEEAEEEVEKHRHVDPCDLTIDVCLSPSALFSGGGYLLPSSSSSSSSSTLLPHVALSALCWESGFEHTAAPIESGTRASLWLFVSKGKQM